MTTFSELGLIEPLRRALDASSYVHPTPIQAQAIPQLLQGRDLLGCAQTGTGKTAAFALPILQQLLAFAAPGPRKIRALILAPTRELAIQIDESIGTYAQFTDLRSTAIFGGVNQNRQTDVLARGIDILVATPGRFLDLLGQGFISLSDIRFFVLDEADRMLDIGFLPDLQRILSFLPKQRTTLLFSATFSPEIKRLAGSYLQDPITIEVARPNQTASTVEQRFYAAQDDDKRRVVKAVLNERGIKQAFIFVNSKLGCGRLARSLEREGLKTAALHGDKTQDERLKALEAFKQGDVDLLVCTDVAARGLDIKDVPAVFNFDVPFNAEDYVHRIGRTGRAGASGLAVTLVSPSDTRLVSDIEKLIKTKLEVENYPLEDDRSRGNDGRRDDRREDRSHDRREERRPERGFDRGSDRGFDRQRDNEESRDRRSSFRPAQVSRDPFFEKPYEAPTAEQASAASWEASAKTVASRPGLSANIKPKRKVAALFKAGE